MFVAIVCCIRKILLSLAKVIWKAPTVYCAWNLPHPPTPVKIGVVLSSWHTCPWGNSLSYGHQAGKWESCPSCFKVNAVLFHHLKLRQTCASPFPLGFHPHRSSIGKVTHCLFSDKGRDERIGTLLLFLSPRELVFLADFLTMDPPAPPTSSCLELHPSFSWGCPGWVLPWLPLVCVAHSSTPNQHSLFPLLSPCPCVPCKH